MRDVVSGRLSPRRNVAALAAIALAGSLAMGAKPPPAGGGAAAQVRVNLVGYAATADEAGVPDVGRRRDRRDVRREVPARRPCSPAQSGPTWARGATRTATSTRSTSIRSRPPGRTRSRSADRRRRRRRRSRSTPAAAVHLQPLRNALSYYQVQRDGPDFVPSALRTRRRPPQRRRRDDLHDAERRTATAGSAATSRRSGSRSTRRAAGGMPATT